MLSRHSRYLDCRSLLFPNLDIYEYVLEKVQVVNRSECFAIILQLG